MANDFLQYFGIMQQMQQQQTQNLMGLQGLGLRAQQQQLTAQGLQLRQQELDINRIRSVNDVFGTMVAAASKMPESVRGKALNSAVQFFNQSAGTNIQGFDIPDALETFAGVEAFLSRGDREGAAALINQLTLSQSPEEAAKNEPILRSMIARHDVRGRVPDFTPMEAGRGPLPMAGVPHLDPDTMAIEDARAGRGFPQAGALAYKHTYQRFKNGGVMSRDGRTPGLTNRSGGPEQIVPDELYDVLHDAWQEEQKFTKFSDLLVGLPPERQLEITDAMNEQLLNEQSLMTTGRPIPFTDDKHATLMMLNEYAELQRRFERGGLEVDSPEYDKMVRLGGKLGFTKLAEADDTMTRVRIQEAKQKMAASEAKMQIYAPLADKFQASAELLRMQKDLVPARLQAQLKAVEKMDAGIERDRQMIELRRQAVESQRDFREGRLLELRQSNQLERRKLEAEIQALETSNLTAQEKAELGLQDMKSRIEYRSKLQDLYDAQIEWRRTGSDVSRQKLELAEQQFLKQAEKIDAQIDKIRQDMNAADTDLKIIDQQRRQRMDLEAQKAQTAENLNVAVGEAVRRGILDDRRAITDMIDELGFRGQMSFGDIQKEARGGTTRMEVALTQPTAQVQTAMQNIQIEAENAKFMLSEFRNTVQDDTVGGIGMTRRLVHGVGQQVSAIANQLFEKRDEVLVDIAAKGHDIDTSRFFDRNLTEFQFWGELLAYQVASVGAGQRGRELSDKDLANVKRALGFDNVFTGKEQILSIVDAAERMIDQRVRLSERVLGGRVGNIPREGARTTPQNLQDMRVDELFEMLRGQE